MRSTVWIVDPARGRSGAEAVAAELSARGIEAVRREVDGVMAVVVENPPEGLVPPEGVLREAHLERTEGTGVTRRALLDVFAGAMVVVTAGAAAGVGALFSSPPPPRREDAAEIDAASFTELKAKGSLRFRFGRDPCILVYTAERIHALSLVCTHLGCLVEWAPDRNVLTCPCHRAAFGLEGNVIEGPPPRPLPTFNVAVVGDRVLVRRRTDA